MRTFSGAKRFRASRRLIVCESVFACFALAGASVLTVLGCGWTGTDHSVRFNTYRSAEGFGRLPRLAFYDRSERNELFSWRDAWYDYEMEERRARELDRLWNEALGSQRAGDLATGRSMLSQYLRASSSYRYAGWPRRDDLQSRRNSAVDRLDALAALNHGSGEETVRLYLQARSAYDEQWPVEEVRLILDGVGADRNLIDNALYLQAALVLNREGNGQMAAELFEKLVRSYPASEKREAAMFMAGVASMRSVDYCTDAVSRAPCRKHAIGRIRAAFQRAMRQYPRGRYWSDARGWLAHLHLKAGDRASALADYYRMLADERDEEGRAIALMSLRMVRPVADEFELKRLEDLIADEPEVALAYAYHTIYNLALEPLGDGFVGPGRLQQYNKEKRELERAAAFASRLIKRYTKAAANGGFVSRVAQASLELGNNAEAADQARKALRGGLSGDLRAEALWVEGVAEYRLGNQRAARRALEALVADSPNNRYTEGARRNLAMLAEDMGDVDAALEHYLALDYRLDVAYFVDVLMSADQLGHFLEKHPTLPHRDELVYSLGVRYLRDRRWSDARRVLTTIRTVGRGDDWSGDYYARHFESRETEKDGYSAPLDISPPFESRDTEKDGHCDSQIRGVKPQWVDRDLRTANDLERLEAEVERAQNDEHKAEALYQLASYQYEGTLLFYNPLWLGKRHYYLYDLDENGSYRRPNEAQLLFEHMQQHDRAARSLRIFLEVVDRFPHTRAARDALFTAAVCHDRLSEYNNYWRGIYSRGGHAGQSMVTYGDVRRAYPDYRLPRGTFGWKPSNRTVDGGPGWHRPPKPKPRPSAWARLGRPLVRGVAQWVSSWNRTISSAGKGLVEFATWLATCLAFGFVVSGFLFLYGRAREARALLGEELKRLSLPASDSEPAPAAGSGVLQLEARGWRGGEFRDQLAPHLQRWAAHVTHLWRDGRGRPVLLLNAATHGLMLAVLLVAMGASAPAALLCVFVIGAAGAGAFGLLFWSWRSR